MKQTIASAHPPTEGLEQQDTYDVSRRKFFQLAGGLAGAGLLLASCHKNDNNNNSSPTGASVSLGNGDTGILNYAYALEQLEAGFYTSVVASTSFPSIFSSDEQQLLTDIRDHEIAHAHFFKQALGSSAIMSLTPNFAAVDFTSRSSILSVAQTFEDTGVMAYNGAGAYISSQTYLILAGKIVSVEARHAAYIRDLVSAGSYANTADSSANHGGSGLDPYLLPSQILPLVQPFIKNTIDGSQLP